MKKTKIKESASSGATSAGSVATSCTGLNFPLQRRIPKTNIFNGYKEYKLEKKED